MTNAIMPSYARIDIAFERGEGAYLYTADGRRYLDFASGVAVNVLGHSHPHLVETLQAQAGKLWHCSNLYRIPEQERLAERLVANSFAETAFFCNSGAEAVEAGLKIVRKYHDANGAPERPNSFLVGRKATTKQPKEPQRTRLGAPGRDIGPTNLTYTAPAMLLKATVWVLCGGLVARVGLFLYKIIGIRNILYKCSHPEII